MYNASAGFYGTEIDNSLRFNDDDSAYLSRTPSSAGNRKTWTWSGWVKQSSMANASGNQNAIFEAYTDNSNRTQLYFSDSSALNELVFYSPGKANLATSQAFRDFSAWYHIVVVADTTNATASDRLKIYVNGERVTSFSTATYPSQNDDLTINNSSVHHLGAGSWNSSVGDYYYDGYLSDIYLIDGTALDPSSFGETKSGIWIPKAYSGSYGTNGFHLEFAGNVNDSSGNGNNWTANNISSHDYVSDSPTNNFAVLNVLMVGRSEAISEGNLKFVGTTSGRSYRLGTIGTSSGKYYCEALLASGTTAASVGIGIEGGTYTDSMGKDDFSWSYESGTGDLRHNASQVTYGASYTAGDLIGMALDADAGTITFYKNGSSQGSYSIVGHSSDNIYFFGVGNSAQSNSVTWVFNFGQDSTFAGNTTAGGNTDANGIGDFKYSVPSGYLALCSANLPELTIDPINDDTPEDYFNTVLYTGTGSTQSITGVGFQPDFVWVKRRSAAGDHILSDSVRTAGKYLSSNLDATEITSTDFDSFDSDGFTVNAIDQTGGLNVSGNTYAAWNWKAGGTAVSNTDGDNTSSVSANTDIGFSIVSYTGSGGEKTVGHGLDQECDMVIVKSRDNTRPWCVMHKDLSSNYNLSLNGSGGQYHFPSQSSNGGIHTPDQTGSTSTTFSLGNGTSDSVNVNGSGEDYIAYCFHSVEGFSKVGSYTGNGSSDGTFVYTGFRPAWVMTKYISSNGQEWCIQDNRRLGYNPDNAALFADLSGAEYASNLRYIDFTSNGFKLRNSSTNQNVNGGKYIYIAFAEQPFKYANAR